MPGKYFVIDARSDRRFTYDQLENDLRSCYYSGPICVYDNAYSLFLQLLQAIAVDQPLVIVDDHIDYGHAQVVFEQLSKSDSQFASDNGLESSNDMCCGRETPLLHRLISPERLIQSRAKIGLLTSGTTGNRKLVLHSLATLIRTVRTGIKYEANVWGSAYHPAHFAGLQVFFQAFCNLNTIVCLYGLGSEATHASIEKDCVTHLSATPTYLRGLVSLPTTHEAVCSVTMGGEKTDDVLLHRLLSVFPNARLRNIYASTEAGSLLTSNGCVFTVPEELACQVRVIDGQLAIHKSLLAKSIFNRTVASGTEFYLTGDCVQVESESPLTFRFIGRHDDFINVGGFKVNPHEVESWLVAMEEVAEAAVFGRSNSVTGNLVCCNIVLVAGRQLTPQTIHSRLALRLPKYAIPRIIDFVETLPRTTTGKRLRRL